MKVKLGVKDRLVVLSLLPPQGDLVTLRVVRKLRENLSFTEAEIAKLEFKIGEGGNVSWKPEETEYTSEIEIGEAGLKLIDDSIDRAGKERKLTIEMLDTVEKFEALKVN